MIWFDRGFRSLVLLFRNSATGLNHTGCPRHKLLAASVTTPLLSSRRITTTVPKKEEKLSQIVYSRSKERRK